MYILNETFEGDFPGAWDVHDSGDSGGEYYWGRRNCRSFEGSHSGWAVGAGKNGSTLNCGADYPDDVQSWMIYGPFNLTGVSAADMNFQLWLNTEKDYDKLFYGASIDGVHFSGRAISGDSQGWLERTFDLADAGTLGSLLGEERFG